MPGFGCITRDCHKGWVIMDQTGIKTNLDNNYAITLGIKSVSSKAGTFMFTFIIC